MKFVFPPVLTQPMVKGKKTPDKTKSPLFKIQCYYNTPKDQTKEDYEAFVDRKLSEVFEDPTGEPLSSEEIEMKTGGKNAKYVMKMLSCVNIGNINLVNDKYYLARHLGSCACKLLKKENSRPTLSKKHLSSVNWGSEETAKIDEEQEQE
jgi:hypothetical protein